MAEAFDVVELCQIKEHIHNQKATIAEYTVNHPIYELCTGKIGCRDQVYSCGGGTRNLNWRRRVTAPAMERRGR